MSRSVTLVTKLVMNLNGLENKGSGDHNRGVRLHMGCDIKGFKTFKFN